MEAAGGAWAASVEGKAEAWRGRRVVKAGTGGVGGGVAGGGGGVEGAEAAGPRWRRRRGEEARGRWKADAA